MFNFHLGLIGKRVVNFLSVAAPEFLGCQGTARALEFRLGHPQKIMRSFLISSRSLLLERMVVHMVEK